MSPGDTVISDRFQIRTISLKCHVDYEVRVLEVAQVRSDKGKGCTKDNLPMKVLPCRTPTYIRIYIGVELTLVAEDEDVIVL